MARPLQAHQFALDKASLSLLTERIMSAPAAPSILEGLLLMELGDGGAGLAAGAHTIRGAARGTET